ncbi:MAG TPA: hypothetical protein VFJ29_06595, partial [Candidatus Kapabacteria bacterium]|nr:hypothetical protein [Candidatus Kapabacteria bacterium]
IPMSIRGKFFLAFVVVMLGALPARSQWIMFKSDADSLVRDGINNIFNLRYEKADSIFAEVIQRYPHHPAGYFFSAMTDWWRIAVDPDTTAFDRSLYTKLQKTIAVCDTLLDTNEFDIVALFFKGGAIGYLGELDGYRDRWVAAAQEGKRGLDILMKVQDIAPTNYDIMLGVGLYDYYAEKIPQEYPFVKPLMLFFPSGDKQLGLQFLRAAAAKAHYANYEAMYQLLRIYYSYENDMRDALPLALQLHNLFPDNTLFERYLGRCYVQLGYGIQWDSVWRDVLVKCQQKKNGYNLSAEREARYYIGMFAMNQRRDSAALANFYICDSLSRALDTDGPSGFMVLTNLKIGMIDDEENKREYALIQYNKVLSWKDFENAHDLAKKYVDRPYGK